MQRLTVPHDVMNEQVILAAALVDAPTRALLSKRFKPDHFFGAGHAAAWDVVCEMDRRGLGYSAATVRQLSGGGVDESYLARLLNAHPKLPPNLALHVETLDWDRARIEAARGPVHQLLEALQNPVSAPTVVQGLARQLALSFNGYGDRRYLRDPAELVRSQLVDIRDRRVRKQCWPFGLEGLDVDRDTGDPRLIPGTAPGQVSVITGVPGCLAGDTIVEFNRAGISRKLKLSEFVRRFNGGNASGKFWRKDIPTTLRHRAVDGYVRLALVKAAYESGTKLTFSVRTEDGKIVRATADHQFLTSDGWAPLCKIGVGTQVWVDAGAPEMHAKKRERKQYKERGGLRAHPFCTSPNMAHPPRRHRVPVHRLVMEAARNGMSYEEFVATVQAGDVRGVDFIDPSKWTVHHKDEDPRNNEISNLELLPRIDHYTLHGREGGWQHVTASTKLVRIVAIVEHGYEPTFDIAMEGEPHNFLANGFVVHNSGKSTMLARIASSMVDQQRRLLFGAWEMKDGATLELIAGMRLGYSRQAMLLGALTDEQYAALESEMDYVCQYVRFLDLPFGRQPGTTKVTNDRNLDLIHGYMADSGCAVAVFDLWKRCLRQTKPEEEEDALLRQQAIAKETNMHCILVQQQRMKDVELRDDKRPTREGIKGSGAWIEVPDTILGTHRPALWKRVDDDKFEVVGLKQRWGKWPFAVEFDWDGEYGTIADGRTVPYDPPGTNSNAADDWFTAESAKTKKGGR